jgi:ferredoxin
VKLDVDWERCEGHGLCEKTAPQMFALDDNGDMHLQRERDPVPAELEAVVAAAARVCPMTALKVER